MTTELLTVEVCNRVRAAREAKGLSRAELAELLGLKPSAIVGIENPTRSLRMPTLRSVAKALGVSVNELLP